MRHWFWAAGAALGSLAVGQSLRPALTTTAIVGAKIEVRPGKVIENGTVLMRDGLILEVGEHVTIPPGTDVLDGKGLYVYAGFIDGGSFKGLKKPEGPRLLTNPDITQDVVTQMRWGSPQVRPDLDAASMYQPDDDAWKGYRSAGFTCAALLPGDGILRGMAYLVNLDGSPRRDSVVAGPVGLSMKMAARGAEYPGTELGAYSITRQTFLDAQWYRGLKAYFNAGSGKRPPSDPTLDAMQPVLAGAIPALFEADEEHQVDRAIELANEYGARPVILGGLKAYKSLEKLKTFKTPVIAALNWAKEPLPEKEEPKKDEPKKEEPKKDEAKKSDANKTDAKTEGPKPDAKPEEKKDEDEPKEVQQERERLWLEAATNVVVLSKAGIPIVLTTRGVKDFDAFFANLRRAVKLGLARNDALAGLTVNVASVYGVDRQLGAVETGKIANLTVLSADFLDPKAKAKFVFIDGRKYEIGKGAMNWSNAPQDFQEEKN